VILLLAHFPSLYEDELLYSGIARYHLRSGNRTQRQTIEDLFGERLVCATADLPSHLGRLASRLEKQYTVDQLIRYHTLFPYYSFYLHAEKYAQTKLLMVEETEFGVIHASLGLLAGQIKSPTHLKYCLLCYQEESARLEPYWHRSHQLPGVVICEKHKIPLLQSTVIYSTRDHKFAYISISHINESSGLSFKIDPSWVSHLQFLAEKSAALLKLPSNHNAPNYRNALYKKGYLTAENRIRHKKLINDFRDFYTEQLLDILQCDIDAEGTDTWLHKLVRGYGEIVQPLRHLLLCRFLGESIERMKLSGHYRPFGQGPWPCLNKAAVHFGNNVVEECKITRCSKTGLPVGTFTCLCGFVYSRRGPDTGKDDRLKIGRIKTFGEVWISQLNELNQTNISLREKADILGVDPNTVKRQTELLKAASNMECNVYHRDAVVESLRKNKLYKGHAAPRIDWGKRDELLYREVKSAMQKLQALDEPLRITVSSIARAITTSRLSNKILKKSLDKLPATKELIQRSIETTEEYQIRRLLWAAEKIEGTGMATGWRILKLAGLNFPLRPPVQEKFKELLDRGA